MVVSLGLLGFSGENRKCFCHDTSVHSPKKGGPRTGGPAMPRSQDQSCQGLAKGRCPQNRPTNHAKLITGGYWGSPRCKEGRRPRTGQGMPAQSPEHLTVCTTHEERDLIAFSRHHQPKVQRAAPWGPVIGFKGVSGRLSEKSEEDQAMKHLYLVS